jgi:hypothetical protein
VDERCDEAPVEAEQGEGAERVTEQTASTRKGFSFSRGPGGTVKVRVQVGGAAEPLGAQEGDDPIPRFREVELTAAEWVDVITDVAAHGQGESRADRWREASDLHMGPPFMRRDLPPLEPRFMVLALDTPAENVGMVVEHRYVRVGDIILATRTGEHMRVTELAIDDHGFVVERDLSDQRAADLRAGDELLIVGNDMDGRV